MQPTSKQATDLNSITDSAHRLPDYQPDHHIYPPPRSPTSSCTLAALAVTPTSPLVFVMREKPDNIASALPRCTATATTPAAFAQCGRCYRCLHSTFRPLSMALTSRTASLAMPPHVSSDRWNISAPSLDTTPVYFLFLLDCL